MYTDPQAITVSGTALSLPRVPSASPQRIGQFSTSDGNNIISVHQNQSANRFRREFRLTQRKIAVDPISAANKEVSASVIVAFDEPKVGFTDAELIALFTGVVASLTASTNAKVVSLLGGEI